MPYKPPMPDEDVAALAAELRPLWRRARAVRPWLRKHAPRLTELVRDEWTWACVGRALTLAGITYRTGRPWDGEHLRSQVARAIAPLKGRSTAPVVSRPTGATPPPPPPPPAPVARPVAVQRATQAPRLPEPEYERLDAKYGFNARVQRRARELRGEEAPPWTQEELAEWRLYEADRRQFPRFETGKVRPQQDEYERQARTEVRREDDQRRFEAYWARR